MCVVRGESTLPLSHRSPSPAVSASIEEDTMMRYARWAAPRRLSSMRHDRRGWGSSTPSGLWKYRQRRSMGGLGCVIANRASLEHKQVGYQDRVDRAGMGTGSLANLAGSLAQFVRAVGW